MRTNNHMTTGAPKILVIALIGNTVAEFGNWAAVSQSNMIIAPEINTAGIMIRWSELVKTCRAKWGTAKPTKAIGPAKAVILPANSPVAKIIRYRDLLRFTPRLFA